MREKSVSRIKTLHEVETYIDRVKYRLDNGAKIDLSFHYAEKAFSDNKR